MFTILVTGATGNVGRPLVAMLATAGCRVRAITRNRHADFPSGVESYASVRDALVGSDAVFLNSRALIGELEETVDAARAAGVRRLVALSAINADDDVARQPSRVRGDRNREVDELVSSSGLEWASLRPSVFASNFAGMWAPQALAGDVIGGPYASASVAPIVDADVSAVGARALTTDDLLGQRIPLTGPQALTNAELVETIGAALGRPLRYLEVDAEVVRQRFLDGGFPAAFADAYMGLLAETVERPAVVTDSVETILGRPATTFAHWAATHRHLFTQHHGR
jgi:uncharacterized protein YbjT (DUF2867 family)